MPINRIFPHNNHIIAVSSFYLAVWCTTIHQIKTSAERIIGQLLIFILCVVYIISERLAQGSWLRTRLSRWVYIYIYIYIYVCHASAHAQDNNNNYYLYVQWVAMVFLVYFPRRFGMQLPLVAMVLREASALMRISSILYRSTYPHHARDIPAWRHRNIPKCDGHVHTYVHTHIMRIDPGLESSLRSQ